MSAACLGVAYVGGADVFVVTVHRYGAFAHAAAADIAAGASVAVVARLAVGHVGAAAFRIADRGRAGVAVVAGGRNSGLARAGFACVFLRTRRAVVAHLAVVGLVNAAAFGVAGVDGAAIFVVAIKRCARDTAARSAGVVGGAGGAVVA